METLWSVSLLILWIVVLVNLLLTLRMLRWLRGQEALRKQMAAAEQRPELKVGDLAPDFVAKTLAGESVGRRSYANQSVAFLFVSPHCGHCRQELPALVRLAPLALERAGVLLVLVSDSSAAQTQSWLATIREEDQLDVPLPVLVAPRTMYQFVLTYNPRGLSPYYCLLDAQGRVQSRGPLGMEDWPQLQQGWGGPVNPRVTPRVSSRYR